MSGDPSHRTSPDGLSLSSQPLGNRTRAILEHWNARPLRKTDISFRNAVESLASDKPLVEFSQLSPARWTLCTPGTQSVAVLSHSAIFAVADDYATGNLVPIGQPVPPGMVEDKVERFPSLKCSYTFVFDTTQDTSLYDLQRELETHVPSLPGWNKDIPRRRWQSGTDSQYTQRFRMRAPMFVLRDKRAPVPDIPKDTHRWLVDGLKERPWFTINPATPKLFALADGKIVDLARCTPNIFVKGDVLVTTFVLSVIATEKGGWGPELAPVELVRVASGDPRNWVNPADYAIPVVDAGLRPSLAEGEEFEGRHSALPLYRGSLNSPQLTKAIHRTMKRTSLMVTY
ncbi:hypothetical protein K466DRAFT_498230 [Polyporus arcularius HHB13444]|uniref:Uncharacterized protein n=1 Tax=Polyporus arcularius HHB13444 TaxID=1314778 RepID=A0A5C3P2R9_9APHY|nr:hypothetical protein K466DRAFT_498230 [Polyporus arcularius HHB13444]